MIDENIVFALRHFPFTLTLIVDPVNKKCIATQTNDELCPGQLRPLPGSSCVFPASCFTFERNELTDRPSDISRLYHPRLYTYKIP
jgi:hypothetical protein